ncbi:YgcG family protein [Pseudomonas sp. D2002]|uniref:TPM domain-containing protein n=1 Tax=Pseudomonas sp. D2002 TaxID=2726980 RepID=UPI0015A45F45|nr:TPM domain-containing protein [Pseudomonas sp. D2002]NWA85365.1 TPM domain-containing protein [Pseudomonas sp. D2002]
MLRWLQPFVVSLLVLMVAGLLVTAQAETSPIGVALDQRVIDLTGTLDAQTLARLKLELDALERRKGSQVAVLLVPTTGDASIEDYANQVFRAWKLGRKDVNDGILLLVAKDDRKVRIEVGYGLEGTVTDLLAHRIIDEHITPAFRQGNYVGGVARGVNDLVVLVDGGDLPRDAETGLPLGASAVLLAFIVGAGVGVLVVTRTLHWRHALIAMAVLTALVVGVCGGREWPVYLVVFPLNLLIGAAVFGWLWRARTVFYCALALLIYGVSLVVVNQYRDVNFFDWLAFLLGTVAILALFLALFWVMKDAWRRSRVGFLVRFLLATVVFVGAGLDAHAGPGGWLLALPKAAFAGVFIFCLTASSFRSGSGGGSSRSRYRRSSSSSGSSSSGSAGGSSGGAGRGGSSGGGGASGSW